MRALRFLHVSALCILVASSLALFGQDEKRQPEQPQRQAEPRPQMNQGEPRQDEAKPSKQERQDQKQQEKQSREQMKSDHSVDNGQRTGRPAGKSAHIPEDKFRANFGRSHTFVIQRPVVVEGRPGFVYGGYSFVLVDAWPADWAYTDDCYVDYIDGEYFLFDLLHPGMRIALFVVM